MFTKFLSAAVALSLFAGVGFAQPDPKKLDDKKLVTKVYTIKHLIGERGKASGLADADAVVKVIFEAIPELRELKSGTDGPQIVERDNGRLEVRTTEKKHADVKDLLHALEHLQDLAIDVTADVIELDAATYEKLVKALAKGKAKPPVLFATGEEFDVLEPNTPERKVLEEVGKILKAGRVVQTSSGRLVNGAEATVSARRTITTYSNSPAAVRLGGKAEDTQIVKEGFGLVALPVVSADRRFVRFKLTEQSTVVAGMKKRELGEIEGKPIVVQSPTVEDLGATGSAVVADGGTMLFKLAYAPKDKVWVVVLKPTIFIRAEEEEIQRQRLQKWFDFFFGR